MPKPAPGHYRLTLPPFPYPLDVVVTPTSVKTALGEFPYDAVEDLFLASGAVPAGLECDGAGHFTTSLGPLTASGSCVGPIP